MYAVCENVLLINSYHFLCPNKITINFFIVSEQDDINAKHNALLVWAPANSMPDAKCK